jgi:hypothetical protein
MRANQAISKPGQRKGQREGDDGKAAFDQHQRNVIFRS